MRLRNKIVMITGAGAGLGRECALLFAREGAKIVATDVDGGRAEAIAHELRAQGGTALALKTDVSLEEDVRHAVEQTVAQFGRLDVMFANAGIPVPGFGSIPFEETSAESWRKVIDVNFTGVFYCAKHAVAPMRAQGGGNIVVTSSAGSLAAFPGFAIYQAAKGGVNQLVRCLAVDLGKYNIRINAICPLHGMSANFPLDGSAPVAGQSYEQAQGAWDPVAANAPLQTPRPPTLLDNAYGALYLASDESAFMSGVYFPTCDMGRLSRVSMA